MLYLNAREGSRRWGWPLEYTYSPIGQAEANGSKAAGTDSHSVFAQKIGQSRDTGKQAWFSLQFGGGIRTLVADTGLPLEVAKAAVDGFRGDRVTVEGYLGEPEVEYRNGIVSGFASYTAQLTPNTVHTPLNRCRPRRTLQEPTALTLGNFPVQGCGVDMRDRLLVKLWSRTNSEVGWPLAMVLHDEQVFELPEEQVDWFCTQLAEAHAEVWKELAESTLDSPDKCPESHWVTDGLEVYSQWRKDIGVADNPDGGYLWQWSRQPS